MPVTKSFRAWNGARPYQDTLHDNGTVVRTEIRFPNPGYAHGYDKHYWEDVTGQPNAFNLAGADSQTLRDKRVLKRWKRAAKGMPCKSWDLNPRLAMAMVRHGVSVFDHRTCIMELTRVGRDLLGAENA